MKFWIILRYLTVYVFIRNLEDTPISIEEPEIKREAITPVIREKRDLKETLKKEAIMELTIKKSKTRPKIHTKEDKSAIV